MSSEPDELPELLRQLRREAGLSGERLAARAGMSQSKISRIESGKVVPSIADVERVLTALDVSPDARRELVSLARRANDVEHTSWRAIAETGFWRKQAELRALAESCTVQRLFCPTLPGALLHTREYATAALSPTVPSDPPRNVERAVEGRLERQKVLLNRSRRFHFLLTEQAVRWRLAAGPVLAAQCAHMAELAGRANIEIAILPGNAEVPGAAVNAFVVYDHRLVVAELFSGEVALRDHRDVAHHLDLFEFFRERALIGDRARDFLLTAADGFR